jgi:Family of unknown function (DUF6636)
MLKPMKRLVLISVLVVTLTPGTAAAFKLRQFQIPGGNIGCSMIFGRESFGGEARCDIRHHSWKAPPKPKTCELDYGSGMVVGARRKAQFVCAGDTVLNQGPVLRRGRRMKLGPFSCKSLAGAVRCVNRHSGHGFKLSRRVARAF